MDAFYASVEERDEPTLKDVPFAVGGMSMISTANYHARKFGVRSAMPGFIAIKLCPQLRFVSSNFEKYTAAAEIVRAILREYDPDLRCIGLDEATLRITSYVAEHGVTPLFVADEIRRRVREASGLTCSCGVAPVRFLAKVCSDQNKPNGTCLLPSSRKAVVDFTGSLPVRKIGGIGKVSHYSQPLFLPSLILKHAK